MHRIFSRRKLRKFWTSVRLKLTPNPASMRLVSLGQRNTAAVPTSTGLSKSLKMRWWSYTLSKTPSSIATTRTTLATKLFSRLSSNRFWATPRTLAPQKLTSKRRTHWLMLSGYPSAFRALTLGQTSEAQVYSASTVFTTLLPTTQSSFKRWSISQTERRTRKRSPSFQPSRSSAWLTVSCATSIWTTTMRLHLTQSWLLRELNSNHSVSSTLLTCELSCISTYWLSS